MQYALLHAQSCWSWCQMALLATLTSSGVGGHALALRGLAKPVAFCEIEKRAREVLKARFPDTHIAEDVRTISGMDASINTKEVMMVTASFPCQDISAAGLRKGIGEGTRSGLVWEIFRVLDECPYVEAVLLENSTVLRSQGLVEIVEAFEKRGYRVAWGNLSAVSVGARHRRARIWVLALKGKMLEHKISDEALRKSAELALGFPFANLEGDVPRLETKVPRSSLGVRRWKAMGNAIVPSVARLAFALLLSRMRADHELCGEMGALEKRVPLTWRNAGFSFPCPPNYPELNLPPGACSRLWLTPVHNSGHFWPNRVFGPSAPAQGMFATRVFYDMDTCRSFGYDREDVATVRRSLEVSPRWVEALMGFPNNWTKV
eukprot:gene28559-31719_t